MTEGSPPLDEEAELWKEAFAFMDRHGERWPDQALAHLNALHFSEHEQRGRWLRIVDMMTIAAQSPSQ